MTPPLVLAVDGGNSKTDLALVRASGEVLALVRGPQSSPYHLGVDGCLQVLDDLLARAMREAGLPNGRRPVADIGELLLAGVDFPIEEEEVHTAAAERRLAARITVGNDTFAVLRAGTEKGWGVAVVCGHGINCIGVGPDGRHARFPALGTVSGDWGGGGDVGMAAVFAAARSEDGRGQKTVLEQIVPEHFGLRTPTELAEAVHRGDVDLAAEMISEEADVRNAASVTPLVLGAAPSDPVAAEIVERLADEIVALVRVALTRLSLLGESVEVLLGGGLFLSGSEILFREVEARLAGVAPLARPQVSDSPPIVGAALLGLDEVGSDAEAQLRVRRELGDAFDRIGGRGKHRVQGRPGTSRAETTSDTAGRRE
jgi:N-acetylglucosamine kinase-like BadF-type ATPase